MKNQVIQIGESARRWLIASMGVLLIGLMPFSSADAKSIFVLADNDQTVVKGDGSKNNPYNTLLINPVDGPLGPGSGMGLGNPGDNILVQTSAYSLNGGVTLQDGQKIQGYNQSVCEPEPNFDCSNDFGPLSAITNDGIPGTNEGAGIVLANNNHVSWLVVHDIKSGHGILGDNVTGSKINHVVIENVNTDGVLADPSDFISQRDPSTLFGGLRCIPGFDYRGCSPGVILSIATSYKGIWFTASDTGNFPLVDGKQTAHNVVMNSTIKNVYGDGIGLHAAGNVVQDLDINYVTILGILVNGSTFDTGSGIVQIAYENATQKLNVLKTQSEGEFNGLVISSGAIFEGSFPFLPTTDSNQVTQLDGYTYSGATPVHHPINQSQSGLNIINFVSKINIFDPTAIIPDTSSVEVHVQNSSIQGAKNTEVVIPLPNEIASVAGAIGIGINIDGGNFALGSFKSVLIDLGCVSNCPAGFTSTGNNILLGNNKLLDFPDPFPDIVYDPGVEIRVRGRADQIGANYPPVKAQNNWWGTSDGAGVCFNAISEFVFGAPPLDNMLLPSYPSDTRCLEIGGLPVGTIDASHPLLSAPIS